MCKESVKYYWSEREKAEKSSSLKYDTDLDNKYNRVNRIRSTRIDPNIFTENISKEVHPVGEPQIKIQAPGQSRATESLKISQHTYS